MLFRNLAFYRYPNHVEKSQRLRDLGFEIIPELPAEMLGYGNYFMWLLTTTMFFMGLGSFCGNVEGSSKPHFINMFRRFSEMQALGHILRFFTYISTTMPGSAEHCFGEFEGMHPPKPKTLDEVFTRFALIPGNNCGDLCFSGHVYQCFLIVLLITKYVKDVLRLPPVMNTALVIACATCAAIQLPFVTAARNHYTVDIVVACYTTPLLWYWHSTYWHPKDMCPCLPGYIDYKHLAQKNKGDEKES